MWYIILTFHLFFSIHNIAVVYFTETNLVTIKQVHIVMLIVYAVGAFPILASMAITINPHLSYYVSSV